MEFSTEPRMEVCRSLREINYLVYEGVHKYLAGKKYQGSYEDRREGFPCHKPFFARIVIRAGHNKPSLYIYFGTSITISVYYKNDVWDIDTEKKYKYFDPQFYPNGMKEPEEYVYRSVRFLRELIRHTWSFHYQPYDFSDEWVMDDYLDLKPDGFRLGSFITMLLHEYSYMDRKVLDYVTDVMCMKSFRRRRGDYRESKERMI